MLNILFFYHAYVLYLLSLAIYLTSFFKKRAGLLDWSYVLVIIGFLIHSFSLVLRATEAGRIPVVGLFESISFFTWSIILFWIALNLRYQTSVLGFFILPVVLLLILPTFFVTKEIKPTETILQRNYWLGIHTTFVFWAYAGFTLAFIGGLAYLILEEDLKLKGVSKPAGHSIFHSLPSLDTLDTVNYCALALGLTFLSGGIITGALGLKAVRGTYWLWTDPKLIWSLLCWLVYFFLLFLRAFYFWRGRKVAILSLIGFVVIIFSFFGVNFIFRTFHAFL